MIQSSGFTIEHFYSQMKSVILLVVLDVHNTWKIHPFISQNEEGEDMSPKANAGI